MLTGRYEAIPGEGSQVTPSTWTSMSDSFKASYNTVSLLTPQSPAERTNLENTVQGMQIAANTGDQGLGQKTANWFGDVAGSALHPLSLLTGELAGIGASKALSGGAGLIGKYLPVDAAVVATGVAQKRLGTFIGEGAPKFVADTTVGGLAKGAVSGFSQATGFFLPQTVAETYNPQADTFNWWGGVKTAFADGGIGLGLMAVPYLAGGIWGKMFRGADKEVSHAEMPMAGDAKVEEGQVSNHPTLGHIDEAEQKGLIHPGEAQWFRDYLSGNLSNEELTNRAIGLLIRDGQPIDSATKRVMLQLFKPEDIERLQSGLSDSLASQVPEDLKPLISKYMTDINVDSIRGKTNMLDGIQGVVKFLQTRLAIAPEERINLNKILRRLLPENVKSENPFTQRKIYDAEKANKSLGVSIPTQVVKRFSHERKIKELYNKVDNYERAFKQTGKTRFQTLRTNTVNKLIELEKSKPELLRHPDEINYLREKLIKDGKVNSNFKFSKDYERLLDLTRVRNSARRLMHEVHFTYEHQMHDHYATFLDAIAKTMRASVGQLADHDSLINYMKERVIRSVPEIQKMENVETKEAVKVERVKETKTEEMGEKIEGMTEEGKPKEKQKTYSDDLVKSFDDEMKDSPTEMREEFDKTKNQFTEFNENQNVLKNLIKCVQGSLNV